MSLLTQFYPGPGGGGGDVTVGDYAGGGSSVVYHSNPAAQVSVTPTPSIATSNLGWVNPGTTYAAFYGQQLYEPGPTPTMFSPGLVTSADTGAYIRAFTGLSVTGQTAGTLTLCNINIYVGVNWTLAAGSNTQVIQGGMFAGAGPTISAPGVTTITGFSWRGATNNGGMSFTCPLLSDVTGSFFGPAPNAGLNFNGTVLTQASVDHVLTTVNAMGQTIPGGFGCTINLGGGCAAPSATGLAAKTALQARNYSVVTN